MTQIETIAAAATAEMARLSSLLSQENRLRQAKCDDGAYAARECIQPAVAHLYECLEQLPADDPVADKINAALDSVALSYEPAPPQPNPAYVQRLQLIAAAAATKAIITHMGETGTTGPQRGALAKQATKESAAATAVSKALFEIPPSNWSKRQARAFETEAQAAAKQTMQDANEASRIYRTGLPYVIMPGLAATRLTAKGRDNVLTALNRHADDSIHVVMTQPADNAERETPLNTAVALVFQGYRYLKTIDEPYPAGYPIIKAVSSLRGAARHLDSEAQHCRVPENQEFYRLAASRVRAAAEQLASGESTTVAGRVTAVGDGTITLVTTTKVDALPDATDAARQLLDTEAVITVSYDEDGTLVATGITSLEH